ncbi:MAG: cyclic nucleotide-binding domain-containing protein [Pseudomonadota bacterium]
MGPDRAGIAVHGQDLGEVQKGDFIAEMSVLFDAAAPATVTLRAPTEDCEIPADALHKLFKNDKDLRLHADGSISRDPCGKLMAANARALRPLDSPRLGGRAVPRPAPPGA